MTILVRGSGKEPYSVALGTNEGGKPFLTCTCQAGALGQLCKHRRAILAADWSILVDASLSESIRQFVNADPWPVLLAKARSAEEQLAEIEKTSAAIKRREKELKVAFGRMLLAM
jgi:SWIM zinc finger